MQAIVTKYHCPTNVKGSRISATCEAGRIYMHYDHELNPEENHEKAARLLAEKLGWVAPHYTPFVMGGLPNNGGYVHVSIPKAYEQAKRVVFMVSRAISQGKTSGNPYCKDWGKGAALLTNYDEYAPWSDEYKAFILAETKTTNS